MRTLRSITVESPLAPEALLTALGGRAAQWQVPPAQRNQGVHGMRLQRRGMRFMLGLRRSRRVVAPVVCVGRVEGIGAGSRISAELRPSRRWLWFPAIGTVLFVVQLLLAPPSGGGVVAYALILGALWAVNVLAAAIPVGSDPLAEALLLERMLRDAATAGPGGR